MPDPSKQNYFNTVYSMFYEETQWDEEIFLFPKLCTEDGGYGRRLTNSPGADFEPRLNKDGTSIVFVSDRNSTGTKIITNIYTMNTSGYGLKRITTTQAQDRMPAFSPDGKKIVFVSTRDGMGDIYTMNTDGTQQKRLTTAIEPDVEPDWSPDGNSIVWVRRFANGTGVLYRMNADGSQQKPITKPLPYLGRPMWSPSGASLLFHLDYTGDGWYEIARMKSDGTNFEVLPLPRDSYRETEYLMGSWLPDETGFIFTKHIYSLDRSTGEFNLREVEAHYAYFTHLPQFFVFLTTDFINHPFLFTPHTVSLDQTPPVSKVIPMPEYTRYGQSSAIWSASDAVSKLASVSIHTYTDKNPVWQVYDQTSYPPGNSYVYGATPYHGTAGDTVYFRSQAQDNAANNEPLKTKPEAFTRLYEYLLYAKVMDAREQPLSGAQAVLTPQAFNQPLTKENGVALVYVPKGGTYSAQLSKPGFAAQAQPWDMIFDRSYTAVLTGADEQIENGHFEAQAALEGWQVSGSYVTSTTGRNPGSAVQLGKPSSGMISLTQAVPLADTTVLPQATALDAQGRMHIVYNDTKYGILDEQGAIEAWTTPLPEKPSPMVIHFDTSDQPYYFTNTKLIRWTGSEWQITPIPLPAAVPAQFALDGQDHLHVIYRDPNANKLMYKRQGDGGVWQDPIFVHSFTTLNPPPFAITTAPDGTAHLAVRDGTIVFMRVLSDGITTEVINSNLYSSWPTISYHYVPGRGAVLVISNDEEWKAVDETSTTGPATIFGVGKFVSLQYDGAGNLFFFSRRLDGRYVFTDMQIKVYPTSGEPKSYSFPRDVSGSLFEVSPTGYPRMIYPVNENGTNRYYFRREVYTKEITENVAEQAISLDAGMHAPTLSFFFRITSPNMVSNSRFEITFTPQGGESVALFSQLGYTANWRHVWVDLTPYQGQSGTLAFRVVQEAGELPIFAAVDEVSVSSLPTPVLESVTPSPAAYPVPAVTWIDLNGQNIWSGAVISIDGTQVTQVEYIDETHVRFLAPVTFSLGTHLVKVANPGGGESWITLYVGTPVFTPLITR